MRSALYYLEPLSLLYVSLLLFIGCNYDINEHDKKSSSKKDSIEIWMQQSKSGKLTLEERRKALEKAYEVAKSKEPDSSKLDYFSKIAFRAELLNNDPLFKASNFNALKLATKLKDTFKIGDAHWNYGAYYSKKEVIDSAYYHFHKAYINFKSINHELFTAKMLYNLGYIQGHIKDYTGSEVSLFEAIAIYIKLNKPLNLYRCYNYLGLIYMELEEYERAIYFHNTALDYLKLIDDKRTYTYKEGSLSNLGLTYQKQKEYNKAIDYFELALKNSNLKIRNISFYARLIDNIAYTKFLKRDTIKLLDELNLAMKLRDSLDNFSGVVISKRHLSDYYAFKLDTMNAFKLANEAYNLADKVENNGDKLETLLLLSKVDKNNANKYLVEYVHLNDSLQIEERKIRNKFTRIRFETDEYIEETEKLSQQKIMISLGAFFSILVLGLAYAARVQRSRNKELVFEREQQKANHEIFSLMLKQQSKLEEGRLKERHRISADLHDGVLGKIFGTRLGLGFLNIHGDDETIEKHKVYIDELQNIEKEIRSISHELKNEILSSKEVFSKIIEDLIEQKSKLGEFNYQFNCDSQIDWDDTSDGIKINFYRIIQESLQNIIKYANANSVDIKIVLQNKNINLTVIDDGDGFDVSNKRKGIGLKNIKSRAKNLEGFFKVNSVINQGTTIFVSCQMQHKSNE